MIAFPSSAYTISVKDKLVKDISRQVNSSGDVSICIPEFLNFKLGLAELKFWGFFSVPLSEFWESTLKKYPTVFSQIIPVSLKMIILAYKNLMANKCYIASELLCNFSFPLQEHKAKMYVKKCYCYITHSIISKVFLDSMKICCKKGRSRWPRCLRRKFAVARLLGLWVRIAWESWIFVSCECCV
jgi:hypothetical protein